MIKTRTLIVSRVSAAFVVSAAMLLAVGCKSEPVELAPQVTESLVSTRGQLFTGKTQVQEAANAARDLVDQPRADLTAQIKRLNVAVDSLNSTRSSARAERAEGVKSLETYFAKWDAELKTMSEETAYRG